MVVYSELVKKARELHARVGEQRFRELFEKHPSKLISCLGLKEYKRASQAGNEVLQAFDFYPLQPKIRAVHDRIMENYSKQPVDAATLARFASRQGITSALRILEARGLVKIVRASPATGGGGRFVVAEVFDKGEWRTAAMPAWASTVWEKGEIRISTLLGDLKAGRISREEFKGIIAAQKKCRKLGEGGYGNG